MKRAVAVLFVLGMVVAGCGGSDSPTVAEYAEEVERLIVTMNSQLDTLDLEFHSQEVTIPAAQAYQAARVQARDDFLSGFTALDRPEDVEDLHDAAVAALTALRDAEQVLADGAAAATTLEELEAVDTGPAREAFLEVDRQAIALCQAAQEAINAKGDRSLAISGPWVPDELQDVITVAFGCTDAERGKE